MYKRGQRENLTKPNVHVLHYFTSRIFLAYFAHDPNMDPPLPLFVFYPTLGSLPFHSVGEP